MERVWPIVTRLDSSLSYTVKCWGQSLPHPHRKHHFLPVEVAVRIKWCMSDDSLHLEEASLMWTSSFSSFLALGPGSRPGQVLAQVDNCCSNSPEMTAA